MASFAALATVKRTFLLFGMSFSFPASGPKRMIIFRGPVDKLELAEAGKSKDILRLFVGEFGLRGQECRDLLLGEPGVVRRDERQFRISSTTCRRMLIWPYRWISFPFVGARKNRPIEVEPSIGTAIEPSPAPATSANRRTIPATWARN